MVFVDISGFTKLSERLARAGREGAEHLVDTISACFSTLLAEAYAEGGSLLKFGGDALLLWFTGEEHALRACTSAVGMRATLRRIGRVRAGGSSVVLRMSVGVHSGEYETYLVGGSHREYIVAGPAASSVVALESHAEAGHLISGAWPSFSPKDAYWKSTALMVVGSILGVLFVSLMRRVMVEDPDLPFPESLAASEIHKAGRRGTEAAKYLFYNLGLGALIQFLAEIQLFANDKDFLLRVGSLAKAW